MNPNFDDESYVRTRRSINKDDLVDGSLQPIEAGSLQMATFLLSDIQRERPYYVTIRAIDKAENAGQVSNLVVFFVPDRSQMLIEEDSGIDLEGTTGFETRDVIYVKQSSFHSISLLVAAFGLILVTCLCVTLLMAVIKHTRAYSSYAGIPASKNHSFP